MYIFVYLYILIRICAYIHRKLLKVLEEMIKSVFLWGMVMEFRNFFLFIFSPYFPLKNVIKGCLGGSVG